MTSAAELAFFADPIDLEIAPEIPADLEAKLRANSDIRAIDTVATKMIRLLDDPRTTIRKVERALRGDVGLASRVLRMANSAAYGRGTPVDKLSVAISRLGFETIRGMALATTLNGLKVNRSSASQLLSRHSVAVAVLARQVALRTKDVDADSAFIAGLLHDLGKYVMSQAWPEAYLTVWNQSLADGWEFTNHEVAEFGTDHATIGAWVCHEWGLHPLVLGAIRLHHRMGALYDSGLDPAVARMVATVRLADDLFRAHLDDEWELDLCARDVSSEAARILGFGGAELETVWGEFGGHYAEMCLLLL